MDPESALGSLRETRRLRGSQQATSPAREGGPAGAPPRLHMLAAFAAVYLIWGSTYLAIRFAIETLPPLLMAGVRFALAGVALYGWGRARGLPRPRWSHWIAATVIGALMITIGNGGLVWAQQRVPSGSAALIVAITPLWMVLFDWLWYGGGRPTGQVILGLALGFAGMLLLVGPEELTGVGQIDTLGAAVIVLASVTWSIGSLHSRAARLPTSALVATAMQMLSGGTLLFLAATLRGELVQVELSAVSLRSLLSLAYLTVFGSLVAFSAYIWLLRVTTPARVATHAYVNPVVAVLLGWGLAGEPLTPRLLIATVVIVGAVVIITGERGLRGLPAERGEMA